MRKEGQAIEDEGVRGVRWGGGGGGVEGEGGSWMEVASCKL